MQVNTQQAALDADPGSVDQAAPARQARQPGDQVVIADGGPGTCKQLAQYFDCGNKRRELSGTKTKQ